MRSPYTLAITWTTAPPRAARPGTTCRPRLRSIKNSGGEAEGNPDHVLHLLGGNAEVARDLGEPVACLKAVDEILDTRPAVNDERLTERLTRVHGDLRAYVGRQPETLGPPIVAVGDPLEVIADDLGEVLLTGPDHRQQGLVVAARGVIEDQLRSVGVHALGGERVIKADLVAQLGDSGPDALHRNAGAAQGTKDERLSETDERHGRAPPGTREDRHERLAVLRARPRVQRRDGCVEVGGALPQGEQRDAETRIVASELATGFRGGGQKPIVLCAPVVSVRAPLCDPLAEARRRS